jgi:hypothetical protein
VVGHLGHGIQLLNTSILSTKFRYRDHIIREVTETQLDSNNINTEDSFCISNSWKPLIYSLKEHRKLP